MIAGFSRNESWKEIESHNPSGEGINTDIGQRQADLNYLSNIWASSEFPYRYYFISFISYDLLNGYCTLLLGVRSRESNNSNIGYKKAQGSKWECRNFCCIISRTAWVSKKKIPIARNIVMGYSISNTIWTESNASAWFVWSIGKLIPSNYKDRIICLPLCIGSGV